MTSRPVFIPNDDLNNFVQIKDINFTWYPGFAISQKIKSISSLHEQIEKKLGIKNILEISTKSPNEDGKRFSAFNLKIKIDDKLYFLESLFQGSKTFSDGGPYSELYLKQSIDSKKDQRIKRSDLKEFNFFGEKIEIDFDFYTWLYFIALIQNKIFSNELLKYEAFTDIEFNPNKSLNCQAYSAALYVSLINNKLIFPEKNYTNDELKEIIPLKKIKNFQPKLI